MREMDGSEGRHAAMHNGKTRESLVLPGRKRAIGIKKLVTRHKGSPGDDQVHNSNRETGAERGGETVTCSTNNTIQP